MQSLKDLKSKNVSSLKVDGSVRTVAGTFAIASNQITGLPTGNKIQAGDRIDLTYTTVATQIETGLVGIADVTGLEPDLGILRIDKTLSQFATIGAVEAAFTDGLLLSFQSGILAGATCNVKYSAGLTSTAADGSAVGDTGYWLVCFNFTTATGLPPLTAWTFPSPIDGTDYTTVSPSIAVFSGVAGPQSLNGLIVSSVVSPTSIAIAQTIPNVASFTDVNVTKHSKINDTLIAENIEATKLDINNEEILPQEHKILSALQIPELTHVWKGINDAGDPICSLDTELGEITPTDAFNVGVDIVPIQMLSHPIDKTIGILLYQNISDSKIYVRCFKFTYSGGFDIVYTPHEIVGADSIDVRMDMSTLISPDGIVSDPLLLIFGGKVTPGPSIYAGVLEINTTTLAITDFLAWGDTIQDVPSTNDFTGLIKAIDLRRVKISVFPNPSRQIGILFNTNRIAYVTFDVQTSTFAMTWDTASSYVDIKNNYFGAAGSGEILCVATNQVVNITSGGDGTAYPIDTNNYATFKKQFYGTANGTLTLFNIDRYKGIGAETIITEGFNEDFSGAVRSNVSYEAFPYNFQYTSAERNDNAVFELGDDKLLFYRSLFYYVIVNKVTGKIVDAARSAGNQDRVYKDNLFAILLNSHTLLYWDSGSSSWVTNKFLYDGPYLAYKNENGFVYFANPGNRIKTSFALEKGKTYYDSYHDTLTGTVSRISPIQGMNPKKIGVALDVDTFVYDPDFSPSTKSKKPVSFGSAHVIEDEGTPVTQRPNINFEGAGVTVDDFGGKTRVTIPGGGGGAAYPDNMNFIGVNTVLNTTTHQGIIFQIGGVLTLPAVAANGTTYKIVGSPNDVKIDTNTKTIIGLGVGTLLTPINPSNGNIHIVALNAPGLLWFIINRTTNTGSWLSTRTYMRGDIAEDGLGSTYFSTSDNNLNNPINNKINWMRLGSPDQQTYAPTISSMVNCSTPTTFLTAYKHSEGWVEIGLRLEITTTGSGLTEFEFDLPVASNLVNLQDLIVSGSAKHSTGIEQVFGEAETTNETGKCSFYATAGAVHSINLIVRYKVI